MLCSSVHEERPSCSTSGGQSEREVVCAAEAEAPVWVVFLANEVMSAKELQVRQLYKLSVTGGSILFHSIHDL